ncbi:MAG: hypothetical protein KKB85_02180 [Candidatus Altiarchaeota archaeon]|nr:hypothetical protein [Candidatus Altiarchaeota archaeon]
MVSIKREGVVLEPTSLEFESLAVMNPACIRAGDSVHMFYRAVRQGNYSSIGYCRLDGPLNVVERAKAPILSPEFDYEVHGVEDPRIVHIGKTYYMCYIAYDGRDAWTAYATSRDLKHFEKRGVITSRISYAEASELFRQSNMPEKYLDFDIYDKCEGDTEDNTLLWGKDSFLFPKKINGKFALIRRVLPEIQVIYFNDFQELTPEFWRENLREIYTLVLPRVMNGLLLWAVKRKRILKQER